MENIEAIFNIADSIGIKIWIVGGALRDYLTKEIVTDIDFVINEDIKIPLRSPWIEF